MNFYAKHEGSTRVISCLIVYCCDVCWDTGKVCHNLRHVACELNQCFETRDHSRVDRAVYRKPIMFDCFWNFIWYEVVKNSNQLNVIGIRFILLVRYC